MQLGRVDWLALLLSATLALAYGSDIDGWLRAALTDWGAASIKASSIVVLAMLAWGRRSRLLAIALALGSLGDFLLATPWLWGFLAGAFAFLIGHLFYIALFLRAGLGPSALKQPPRALAALALIAAAIASTSLLVPRDDALFAPLSVYTGVLTLMAITSIALPAARWLAMLGAVFFFISDGFVAADLFHAPAEATAAFWLNFSGWMIYWAGQAALCVGALGLHKQQNARDP